MGRRAKEVSSEEVAKYGEGKIKQKSTKGDGERVVAEDESGKTNEITNKGWVIGIGEEGMLEPQPVVEVIIMGHSRSNHKDEL